MAHVTQVSFIVINLWRRRPSTINYPLPARLKACHALIRDCACGIYIPDFHGGCGPYVKHTTLRYSWLYTTLDNFISILLTMLSLFALQRTGLV
ncbi:hypothetical protein PZA11_002821 [Diplocarpon coronariae]